MWVINLIISLVLLTIPAVAAINDASLTQLLVLITLCYIIPSFIILATRATKERGKTLSHLDEATSVGLIVTAAVVISVLFGGVFENPWVIEHKTLVNISRLVFNMFWVFWMAYVISCITQNEIRGSYYLLYSTISVVVMMLALSADTFIALIIGIIIMGVLGVIPFIMAMMFDKLPDLALERVGRWWTYGVLIWTFGWVCFKANLLDEPGYAKLYAVILSLLVSLALAWMTSNVKKGDPAVV